MPDVARIWVEGLALARRNPPPVEVPWGLRVDVGWPREQVRHVLLRSDEEALRAAAAAAAAPNSWIKAFLDPGRALAALGPDWHYGGTEFLMAATLDHVVPHAPENYRVTAATDDGVTQVQVRTASDELAAAGLVAVVGGVAVMDRVATSPVHQRRRLGTLVAQTLTAAALEQGARTAVLGATVEGRALYTSLGWAVLAPLAGFVRPPARRLPANGP